MLEKILKIGGLCLLGLGGIIMLFIPGLGWVTGSTAIVMAATGAGACVGAVFGAQSYIQAEKDKQIETDLREIELRLAFMEKRNYLLDHEIQITKTQLSTTTQLRTALQESSKQQISTAILQDQEIDRLQQALQEKTRECSNMKMLLAEHDIDIGEHSDLKSNANNMTAAQDENDMRSSQNNIAHQTFTLKAHH